MEKAGHRTLPMGCRDYLDNPITEGELQAAVRKGASSKAPGRDGICPEFFEVNWNSITDDMLALFNRMYLDGRIMEQQKHGIVVCIPKTDTTTTPADYRPITLLNTDYKILARITVNRLRLLTCYTRVSTVGVPGNTICDAVATVRDAIAYAPLCNLSLDLTAAFERISHTLLFRLLKCYDYTLKLITLIQAMYDTAFSSVQING
jgi:Reverse transcriptase (RNA-dependent DNA polymerase).